jgi:hypothetical protein
LRKMMMLATMLALVLAVAIPAVAQVGNGVGQESESGDVNVEGSVSSEGDYASQCVAPLQFGNTGNLQNGQAVLQYDSTSDDISLGGSTFGFGPSVSTECDQKVQQSAAASS